MKVLVLDSEAFGQLARARQGAGPGGIHAALKAAVQVGAPVLVPAAVLAEHYRGGHHDQITDSCLGRVSGISVQDTDRPLARLIGNILARAGRGSQDHVDATVVATAVAAGGGVIATCDIDDLSALASDFPGIVIEPVAS